VISPATLSGYAVAVLETASPDAKVQLTETAAKAWRAGGLPVGKMAPPDRPARPEKPELLLPREMPKRSMGPKGRIALVHALAHIELNAVDLAWDIIARFGSEMPRAFMDDWVDVAVEEAEHYAALAARLRELDVSYGALPAHDGLWEVAMTLEARGLDTTPPTTAKLRASGDAETAAILDVIYADEIKHLAIGVRWFEFLCAAAGKDPYATYKETIDARFPGGLRPPFNMEARDKAGMGEAYLRPWTPTD
jgi:uncharacterized ferritin-like protein (DUF455 family)